MVTVMHNKVVDMIETQTTLQFHSNAVIPSKSTSQN